VVAVALGAVAFATASDARALNAIVAPALIALIAGAVQVVLADPPAVERTDPVPGYPGESRTVELTVGGGGLARVIDAVPRGMTARGNDVRTTLPATISYEVDLEARGEWTVGPPRVSVTDVFGLFVDTVEPDATATAVAYPPVVDLRDHGPLAQLLGYGTAAERQAFDSIREYAPGDPLRDVHWKSSAKRGGDDLVVKEFVSEDTESTLYVAASATPQRDDAMATAAASVALLGLEAGLSVGVACPAGEVPPARGEDHRHSLLRLLARTGAGQVSRAARERADVVVTADDGGVVVTVDGREFPIDPDPETDREPATGSARRGTTDAADRPDRIAGREVGS